MARIYFVDELERELPDGENKRLAHTIPGAGVFVAALGKKIETDRGSGRCKA